MVGWSVGWSVFPRRARSYTSMPLSKHLFLTWMDCLQVLRTVDQLLRREGGAAWRGSVQLTTCNQMITVEGSRWFQSGQSDDYSQGNQVIIVRAIRWLQSGQSGDYSKDNQVIAVRTIRWLQSGQSGDCSQDNQVITVRTIMWLQ